MSAFPLEWQNSSLRGTALHRLGRRMLAVLLLWGGAQGDAVAQTVEGTLQATYPAPSAGTESNFGYAVAWVGEVTGDETPDLLIGAPEEGPGGVAYLVDGADGRTIRKLTSPDGEESGEFGGAVAGVGDITGDGTPDLLVGAEGEGEGRAYLFSGAEGRLVRTLRPPQAGDDAFRGFGASVAVAGDVDGDGTPDLLIGAPDEDVEDLAQAGRAYLFDGADGELHHAMSSPNIEEEGEFGGLVAGVGDVDGDGTPDLLIGAPTETAGGAHKAGRAYLISGGSGRVLHALTSPNPEERGWFGNAAADAGDLDGDGTSELLVGAYRESLGGAKAAGRVHLVDGGSGDVVRTLRSPNAQTRGYFGGALAVVGDVDGDGTGDHLITAPREEAEGSEEAGRAYVFSGEDGELLRTFGPPDAPRGHWFGWAVSGASGEPGRQFIVGAPSLIGDEAGRVYRYSLGAGRGPRPVVDVRVPETGMSRPGAVAVVVGIRDYEHGDVPDVDYALRDARVMEEYLVKALGYREENVLVVEDATGAELKRLFGTATAPEGRLHDYVGPGTSEVFVYYSGHGAPNPNTGRAYLMGSDTDPAYLEINGYPVERLYENLAELGVRSVTVVLEACFSGVSEAGAVVQDVSPAVLSVENPVMALEGGLALTAGAADQVSSWYPEKGHGLFTYYFLRGLRGAADGDGDGAVTGGELGAYLREVVPYRARRLHSREQTPQVAGRDTSRVLVEYDRAPPGEPERRP